jgi:nitrous oxide reductase accessory protein NosL
MLFKIQAFKSPSIVSSEKLYSLNVLNGMNEQQLPLKDELSDDFVFCQTVQTACGVVLAQQLQLSSDSVRYRMKKGGQITGFVQVTKPYVLRRGNAKALNESRKY